VLCEHKETLVHIFHHFADSEGTLFGKAAKVKKVTAPYPNPDPDPNPKPLPSP
jgi:hypothetical protein